MGSDVRKAAIVDRLYWCCYTLARNITAGNLHLGNPVPRTPSHNCSWRYRLDWFLDCCAPIADPCLPPYATNKDPIGMLILTGLSRKFVCLVSSFHLPPQAGHFEHLSKTLSRHKCEQQFSRDKILID
jgi:hypothetical protein